MKAVRFFGPIGDSTGYGMATWNIATAFSRSGVKTQFQFGKSSEGRLKNIISELNSYPGDCQIDFYLHGPPWDRHKSNNYKIAYFYWEADILPPGWVKSINRVNEIWAPCDLVKSACLKAGFKGIIRVVPTPSEHWNHHDKIYIPSSGLKNHVIADDIFKFYSIFQWHERKGFRELLSAYWSEFSIRDRVLLILKVNPLNFVGYDANKIKADVFKIRTRMGQRSLSPVFLSSQLIDRRHIQAIHNVGDCYVSPHHGEGWGLPIHDAMLSGKEIITTKFGGVTEFLDDDSANIIPHTMGPVVGMDWSPALYSSRQKWAYPSVNQLGGIMRGVYDNKNDIGNKGKRARKIADSMTISETSKLIDKFISEI